MTDNLTRTIITNFDWLTVLLLMGIILVVGLLVAKPVTRYIIKKVANDFATKLLTDKYSHNLAEFLPSLKRISVLNTIELSLRAEEGKIIARPLGTPKHFLSFENLMFQPHQMTKLPLPESTTVDMNVLLGPKAEKPLTIKIPLMISAMAYGLALSEEAKLALAKAANRLGTATCSGEGPLLPEEQVEAEKYIMQISRWYWGDRTDDQIANASVLEVQMGQGADMGAASLEAKEIAGRARKLGGMDPNETTMSYPAPPGVDKPEDWPRFMQKLRKRANGIPIGLKLMATDHIEEDLAVAVELGFDIVIIDGAQGGSHAAPPIKQDDFGIPTLHALVRAKRFLKGRPISLVIAGGFFTPGQCLKALALGADAIYLATIPLFALAHNQVHKVLPWEPITTLVYYDSPTKVQLNVEQAATSVYNIYTSMVLEMEEAVRALGKASLKELGPDDLVALDAETAAVTGVTPVYRQSVSRKISTSQYSESGTRPASTGKQCHEQVKQLNNHLRDARLLTNLIEKTLAYADNNMINSNLDGTTSGELYDVLGEQQTSSTKRENQVFCQQVENKLQGKYKKVPLKKYRSPANDNSKP